MIADKSANQQWREDLIDQLKEHMRKASEKVAAVWNNHEDGDDNYQDQKAYQDAVEYLKKFEEKEGVEYGPVIEYAREVTEKLEHADKLLDEKADSIVKYLGGGTAVVTFGALVSLKAESTVACLVGMAALVCLIPSFIYSVRAVRAAVSSRRPRNVASLPATEYAIKIAEHYKEKGKIDINLWLSLYPLSVAAQIRNMQKAKKVHEAHNHYHRAIAFLGIPIAGVVVALFVLFLIHLNSPPSPAPLPTAAQKP